VVLISFDSYEFFVKLGKIRWTLDYVMFIFFDELVDGMAVAPEAFTDVRMLAVHVCAAHLMPIFVILASTCSWIQKITGVEMEYVSICDHVFLVSKFPRSMPNVT